MVAQLLFNNQIIAGAAAAAAAVADPLPWYEMYMPLKPACFAGCLCPAKGQPLTGPPADMLLLLY
jgi:hypothetical protein